MRTALPKQRLLEDSGQLGGGQLGNSGQISPEVANIVWSQKLKIYAVTQILIIYIVTIFSLQ
jgi:hypothetical protein